MEKQCTKCKCIKDLSEFTVRRASPDGLNYKCRDCMNLVSQAFREKHPNRYREWHSQNRERRLRYHKDWAAKNQERKAANNSRWLKENKDRVNARNARRVASRLKATPSWANQLAIQEFYKRAAFLTKITGIKHEVDHLYPLQGELVCGLHCEANLQILTKTENIRKKNRMPEEVA